MHIPVLQKEVLEKLDPKANQNFIDGTIGGGGHALAVLERTGPEGIILGIDRDPEQIKNLEKIAEKFKKRIILECDNFANLKEIVKKSKLTKIHGVLLDLGMSSRHIEESKKGFSFLRSDPLDMRYGLDSPITAEKILNYWSEIEIEKILREFGEERFAKNIAKEIIISRKFRPIETTLQLVDIIKKALPSWYCRQKTHFATRTFQSLRIAVNDELKNLQNALPQVLDVLTPGGKIVIISFHSLEDRIVKKFIKEKVKEGLLGIITKKPITPSPEEIKNNPRSRSAKLRAAQLIK